MRLKPLDGGHLHTKWGDDVRRAMRRFTRPSCEYGGLPRNLIQMLAPAGCAFFVPLECITGRGAVGKRFRNGGRDSGKWQTRHHTAWIPACAGMTHWLCALCIDRTYATAQDRGSAGEMRVLICGAREQNPCEGVEPLIRGIFAGVVSREPCALTARTCPPAGSVRRARRADVGGAQARDPRRRGRDSSRTAIRS